MVWRETNQSSFPLSKFEAQPITSSHFLGSGGYGTVYKGSFSNEVQVAVKVSNGTSDEEIKDEFMAEVSTIGKAHHFNLVRMYGYCFEANLKALVYEYMENGSLDSLLFQKKKKVIKFETLHDIAIGAAKGLAYLHEESEKRIIHYDIKPGNILDKKLNPKIADFGLAKLCDWKNAYVTMTGMRGTPVLELWMPFLITEKCDVNSFGMLLFEIIGRTNNLDQSLPDSQEWFPRWVWSNFENAELEKFMVMNYDIAKDQREKAIRMVKVALWCIHYRPEMRPVMTFVVKMLEGRVEIPTPSNPFQHMELMTPLPDILDYTTSTDSSSISSSSQIPTTGSSQRYLTPLMSTLKKKKKNLW